MANDKLLERLFNHLSEENFNIENTALNEWIANKDNLRVIIEWQD